MTESAPPVIVLEDDAALRALMAEALREAGRTVTEVVTGPGLLAALEAVAGQAILVADRGIESGGQNGFQIAAEALERYAALRVVYISGTHIAVRRRALGERERALLKPFAMAQLLGALGELR